MRSRLASLVVVLVIASVLAGCSSDSTDSETSEASGSELPEGAQAVIDEYLATWEDKDMDGWWATVRDDYFYRGVVFSPGSKGPWPDGPLDLGARERATNIEFKNAVVPEQLGDNLVVGDGPWVVSVKENWVEADIRFDGVGTYVVVEEDDGTMKIGSHAWTGTAGSIE